MVGQSTRFIPDGDQIVSKTHMTRVEGETHGCRSTWQGSIEDAVLFQVRGNAEMVWIIYLLPPFKFWDVPVLQ